MACPLLTSKLKSRLLSVQYTLHQHHSHRAEQQPQASSSGQSETISRANVVGFSLVCTLLTRGAASTNVICLSLAVRFWLSVAVASFVRLPCAAELAVTGMIMCALSAAAQVKLGPKLQAMRVRSVVSFPPGTT